MPLPASVTQTGVFTEVPDYLRTSSWSRVRGMLVGIAAVVLIGAGLFFFTGLRERFFRPAQTASNANRPNLETANNSTGSEALQPAERESNNAELSSTKANGTAARDAASTAPAADVQTETAQNPPGTEQTVTSSPQPLTPGIAEPSNTASESVDPYAPVGEGSASTGPQFDVAAATDPIVEPTDGASDQMTPMETTDPADKYATAATDEASSRITLPSAPATTSEIPTDTASETPDAKARASAGTPNVTSDSLGPETFVPDAEAGVEPTTEEEVPAGPVELGTYLGGETVLLRHDDEKGSWFRIAPRQGVIAGDRLLALPQFRPEITLVNGVHVAVSGGTQVMLRTAENEPAEETPGG